MAKFTIPTKDRKLFIQSNKSDIFGNLYATFNMDFDTILGKARVAPRLRINTDDTDDANLGKPAAFIFSTTGVDRWWALCGARLFRTADTDPSTVFTLAATDDGGITAPPTTMSVASSDLAVFNGRLYVSLPTNIAELDNTTWDNTWWTTVPVGTALTTGIPHPIHVTERTKVFLVGDGNLVHVMNSSETVSNSRLIFETKYQVTWIRSTQNGAWIGLRNTEEGEGAVAFWDESAENYNRLYGIKGSKSFACVIKNGLPHIVNNLGQLLKFTGSGFDEVAVFPVFRQINKRWATGLALGDEVIGKNGMALIEEKIHINIDNAINEQTTYSDSIENFPAGIWTYDEQQGLRHKYSFSQYDGTEIDYGAWGLGISGGGALVLTNPKDGLFLAGGVFTTNAIASSAAIYFRDKNDSIVKRGYFVTSLFEASSFEDIFQDLLLKFKRFKSANDRIVIKYRVVKNINLPIISALGTWSDTDTFTSTADLSNVSAGDEVEIIKGRGAGANIHIDSISLLAGTYTVNLKETIPNVSGTMRFNVHNFRECARISTQGIERQAFDLDVSGTWLQLKVELRSAGGSAGAGASPELEELAVNSKTDYAT